MSHYIGLGIGETAVHKASDDLVTHIILHLVYANDDDDVETFVRQWCASSKGSIALAAGSQEVMLDIEMGEFKPTWREASMPGIIDFYFSARDMSWQVMIRIRFTDAFDIDTKLNSNRTQLVEHTVEIVYVTGDVQAYKSFLVLWKLS